LLLLVPYSHSDVTLTRLASLGTFSGNAREGESQR
jgi:hypothetical protein